MTPPMGPLADRVGPVRRGPPDDAGDPRAGDAFLLGAGVAYAGILAAIVSCAGPCAPVHHAHVAPGTAARLEGPAPARVGPVPLCAEEAAPRAVHRAVAWWGRHGVDFVPLAADDPTAIPGWTCVPVFVRPALADLGLRGLTILQADRVPIVSIADAGDALALAHELGHVVFGGDHDPRPGHILSGGGANPPGWRR